MQQENSQIIEQEYERFIEFSNVLDRKSRKYLVQFLKNKLNPDVTFSEELNDQYFLYFKKALDQLFAINDLLSLCSKNEMISKQIILDTLYWLKKTWQKSRAHNPFESELNRLEGWAVTPFHIFKERWPFLINFLKQAYSKEQLNTDFYRDRFKELLLSEKIDDTASSERKKMEMLINDILAQWDALLHAKILEVQLQKLEEEKEEFIATVETKVEEFIKLTNLLAPFSEYLGRYWDMSRELWEDSSFDILKEYSDLLEDEESIKELADLLGKMREAEIEIEEEEFEKTIIRKQWVVDEEAKSQIVGVHESDDLNNVLSSEVSLLGDEDTESLFLKKYADKNLLTFRYEDRKLVKSKDHQIEINQKVKQKEKGPFIICVDTSESMHGRPEQIAKVLCLGILKMAAKENRPAYLINFSTGVKTLDLYNVAESIDEIAKFLRMSFYGGTDISLPLYEAVRQLKTNNFKDADVLVISDFIMYRIDENVLRDVRFFQQNQGTLFHSLTLSKDPNTKILEAFDNNWLYAPKKKGIIKELTKDLREENILN